MSDVSGLQSSPITPQPQGGACNERSLIRWIRRRSGSHAQVPIGPGDDTAVLRLPDRPCLVTTDMMMEGVHFDLRTTPARLVGRKALAINLSDIAAMAGRPVAAFPSVALPRGGGEPMARELLTGIQSLAEEFGVAVAGGDTNSWQGPLVVSLTLVGEAGAKGPVLRRGAKTGDWILVTGVLGGSLAGRHLTFQPRVSEAALLHDRYELHAMIDISDGLSTDLHHLLEESGCGAVVRAEAIPISDAARSSGDGRSPLEHALHDGEDFELLLTAPPDSARRMMAEQPLQVPLTHLGEIAAERGAWLYDDGTRRVLSSQGWEHRL